MSLRVKKTQKNEHEIFILSQIDRVLTEYFIYTSYTQTRGVYEKDTVKGYLPDQDITAPWWASKAEDWWTLAATNDFWLGGFVWTGMDYRGEPTPYQWPNINSHFGIMDMCGFPKNIYYYYKSWWTDKDVLHISPHWNWREKTAGWNKKQGDPVEVWVNSNADNVELLSLIHI